MDQRIEDQHQRVIVGYPVQVHRRIVVNHDLPVTASPQSVFGVPARRQLHQRGFPGLQSPSIDSVGHVHVHGAPHVAHVVAHERPAVYRHDRGPVQLQLLSKRVRVQPFNLKQTIGTLNSHHPTITPTTTIIITVK